LQTGRTDIPLTENGVNIIKQRAPAFVGTGNLVDPANICYVFVSPRQRAHKTFHLLFADQNIPSPAHEITEDVREWDYGDLEGLKPKEIKAKLGENWSIWKDGCPGGESVEDITKRIDSMIAKIREIHRKYKEDGIGKRDVLIVAHGHFSRCFISRWFGFELCLGTHFNVEPAGVALLTYNHNNLNEPSMTGLNLYAV